VKQLVSALLIVVFISVTCSLIVSTFALKSVKVVSSRNVMSSYIFVIADDKSTSDVLSASTLTALVSKSVSIPIIV
jgi:hypothetical protein